MADPTRAGPEGTGRPSAGLAPPPRSSHVGRPAPDLAGHDPAGVEIRVRAATDGRPSLIAFATTTCETCQPVWEMAAAGTLARAGTRLVLVAPSPSTESARAVRRLAPAGAEVVMSSAAWFEYEAPGAPWFVTVGPAEAGGIVEAEGRRPSLST
jgi:hypothetical protein